jgi:hypothetical protein
MDDGQSTGTQWFRVKYQVLRIYTYIHMINTIAITTVWMIKNRFESEDLKYVFFSSWNKLYRATDRKIAARSPGVHRLVLVPWV